MHRYLVVAALLALAHPVAADDEPLEARGEVIVIEGKAPPITPPKATNVKKRATPPYSDRAVLSDAWTRAWLLLEIDERGHVARVKWLRRPGYDLEPIAIREVFALRFTPALDSTGAPMRSTLIWDLEWPSAWWLSQFVGTRSTAVPIVGHPPRRMDHYVPCRGSGPWNMGSIRPTYKDCSKPDLTKVKTEAWIERPR